MRVATLNILHGVPLRDVPVQERSTQDARSRRRRATPDSGSGATWPDSSADAPAASPGTPPSETGEPLIDPAFDGDQLGESLEALPEGIDAADLKIGGADPTRRVQWSPTVSDPSELLRAVQELQQVGPLDVIALQEVDLRQPRTALADQAALVAEAIGAEHWRFVPAIVGIPGIPSEGADWIAATPDDDPPIAASGLLAGRAAPAPAVDNARPANGNRRRPRRADDHRDAPQYGVALVSRYPVREWRVRRFPPAPMTLPLLAPTSGRRPRAVRVPDEPRAAVAAVVEAPNADLTIATAHLSFVPGYNTRQLLELRAFLAGMPRPMILLGDFNTPGGVPGLVTGWDQVARVPTYPVLRPRVQFDHIMADGWTEEALIQARESSRALPLPISDHCALVASFPDL